MLEPLSSILRPDNLDEYVGQTHLVGAGKPIRAFLENKKLPSMIFWGPPGTGKTTLAYIISKQYRADFVRMSGVSSKKQDFDKIKERAKINFRLFHPTIVFLDEIHRWNKAQQDALLPYVEKGVITLIGATTENPSFSVNNALLSRCRTFVFNRLTDDEIVAFIQKNLKKIIGKYPGIILIDEIINLIAGLANGDMRSALNILEATLLIKGSGELTIDDVKSAINKTIQYDKNGQEHYDVISAVHKSLRDSDPDASCYWIQRMLVGGEDPLFILRRLIRFASEDIGIADNNALIFANNCYESFQKVGSPEGELFIFQLAIYLANAPKSNLVYKVYQETKKDVEQYGNLPVPLHLRNASTDLLRKLGYGEGYKYAHDYDGARVLQEHFPIELKGKKYIDI